MAAKRGKSQARRNNGNSGGLPGWAWLVLGVVLDASAVVLVGAEVHARAATATASSGRKPNPDAQPAATSDDDDDAIVADDDATRRDAGAEADAKPKPTQYDFYTLLPGDEVRCRDAELAATAREEAARKASARSRAAQRRRRRAARPSPATQHDHDSRCVHGHRAGDEPIAGDDTPYLLQAGAFGASGDAEAVKAKIALLGLSARVESAQINGKTVYRVRMGPYGTASELAEAKRKLANGGLPAMAIKVK